MRKLVFVTFLTLLCSLALCQFTDINAGLPGLCVGTSNWCDLDNDGDLDIVATGLTSYYPNVQRATKLFRNDGNSVFTEISTSLPGFSNGAVAPADFDNDGDTDLLVSGLLGPYQPATRLYRNEGNFVFTQVNAWFEGVEMSAMDWADFDDDGDRDIVLNGFKYEDVYTAKVYRNDGNGVFTDIGAGLEGMGSGSVKWADFEADGDPDILMNGYNYYYKLTIVYLNEGDGTFTDINCGMTGVYRGSAEWYDLNGDADLDAIVSGFDGMGCSIRLYRNNAGWFTPVQASFPASQGGKIALADYDRDGDMDILHHGFNGTAYVMQIYRNDGGNAFTDINAGLPFGMGSSADWGDYDNDGDKDILLALRTAEGTILTRIYRNDFPPPVLPIPAEPQDVEVGLTAAQDIVITWSAVQTDVQGNPLTVEGYIVLEGNDPEDEDSFAVIGLTDDLFYTVPASSNPLTARFFRVIALGDDAQARRAEIASALAEKRKIRLSDLQK